MEATEVGNYQPLPYLLPALALKASNDSSTGLWLSRLASAIPCLAFILLAVAMLWNGTSSSVLGLLIAITPMVLFVSSVMNPNGLELGACLAFAASVLRIARAPSPSRAPAWVWVGLAVSGAVAILAWQLGPVFVMGDLALGVVMLGPPGLSQLRRSGGRHFRHSAFTLIAAAILCLIYSLASGVSHSTFGLSPISQSLHAGLSQLDPVLRDSVGTFGSLTVHWLGAGRDRWLLAATVVLASAFPVLFYAWVYRFTGFGLQGRCLLPVMVLIPLLAGEMIHQRLGRLSSPRSADLLLGGAAALIAVFQAYAWWFNAKAAAGAPHTDRFYAHALWSPPARMVALDRACDPWVRRVAGVRSDLDAHHITSPRSIGARAAEPTVLASESFSLALSGNDGLNWPHLRATGGRLFELLRARGRHREEWDPGWNSSSRFRRDRDREGLSIGDGWLLADRDAPAKQRHSARRIWRRLVDEHGADVAEVTVRQDVRARKRELGWPVGEVFVPQVHAPGVEAEVDWSEALVVLAGVATMVHLFVMRASFSGAAFCQASLVETQQAFLELHVQAFEWFDGVFPEIRFEYVPRHIFGLLCPT